MEMPRPKEWEKVSREDHEVLKGRMSEKYKKAERTICRSLMISYEEKFLS